MRNPFKKRDKFKEFLHDHWQEVSDAVLGGHHVLGQIGALREFIVKNTDRIDALERRVKELEKVNGETLVTH